jgi:hypothetical protein
MLNVAHVLNAGTGAQTLTVWFCVATWYITNLGLCTRVQDCVCVRVHVCVCREEEKNHFHVTDEGTKTPRHKITYS